MRFRLFAVTAVLAGLSLPASALASVGHSTLRVDPVGNGALLRASSTIVCPAGYTVALNRVTYQISVGKSWTRYRSPGARTWTTPSRAVSVLVASAMDLENYGYNGSLRLVSETVCQHHGRPSPPIFQVDYLPELQPTVVSA